MMFEDILCDQLSSLSKARSKQNLNKTPKRQCRSSIITRDSRLKRTLNPFYLYYKRLKKPFRGILISRCRRN